ncbi:MAG TPA: cation-translocating P-type ATPase [Gemmatimonadaceae bacterium]
MGTTTAPVATGGRAAPRDPAADDDRRGRVPWHSMPAEAVLDALAVSDRGLSTGEASRRLTRDGPNALRRAPRTSALAMVAGQLRSPVVALLLVAVVLTAVTGDWLDAAAIAAVLVLNATIGVTIELRARRALESLLALEVPRAVVLRDGRPVELAARELVVGDVVIVDAGRRVPADARLIESAELETAEAILTGESVPVAKDAHAKAHLDTPLAERATMLYQATSVTRGRARAVVVATGMATEVGRIGTLTAGVGIVATPLERRLASLARLLAGFAIAAAFVVALAAWLGGAPLAGVVPLGIAVAVAAIPEGLPAISTIALAVGVRRMAKRNAVVRRLPTVETLGSTTIICTDKTGTLTGGAMRATSIWLAGQELDESALARLAPTDVAHDRDPLSVVLRIVALANRAHLDPGADAAGVGDPTELALLALAQAHGAEPSLLRAACPEVAEVPFSSERMLMATIHRVSGDGLVVYAKGAPARIVERCERILMHHGESPLTDSTRAALAAQAESMAERGLRVLALATGRADCADERALNGLVFAGFVGLSDPPAPGVSSALDALREAGIRVVMLTGDHRRTAEAIGRRLGIVDDARQVVDGPAIERVDDATLDARLGELAGVSRVSPATKLRVVRALQRRGEVVAMLGDGVNDAAALRQADVGVAMGGRGSDLAKEVAGIVLADDRFETIVAATEEGRRIGANIRRAVFYLAACNLAELLVVLTAAAIGHPIPLTPLQILWLNLLTDTLPALSLAVGPAESRLMHEPPRAPGSPILSRRALGLAVGYAIAMTLGALIPFELMLRDGRSLAGARTAAFFALALTQIAQLANAYPPATDAATRMSRLRSPIVAAALATLALQLLPLGIPLLRRALAIDASWDARGWVAIALLALAPVCAGWVARVVLGLRRRMLAVTQLGGM